ncbi:CWF19-like protein 1 homolog isoform X2 [Musca domestica]|uniref:CWF19-like protein 1 homolog isoform X2 n=1 Tax=Musca domestica TaxID=7370 RepID=A0A1I8M7F3_MUSDO|nr:CWF19-like protein 1 homolog isoform X2 [Musca domestica]
MDQKIKVLVCGDVRGRFKQMFQRVESINKKAGPFEILLCVGDFFSEDEKQNEELIAYRNGHKHIPVPTYILGPNNKNVQAYYENTQDGEICSNLTYLGKRGLYTLSSGVKIAYISGLERPAGATEQEFYFGLDDIEAVRNSCLVNKSSASDYRGVDILLSSPWPHGITTNDGQENKNTSKLLSFLCRDIKPRYHFCAMSKKYFEPAPYRLPSDQITQLELCTRFISLADVGNAEKEKYIYALSLTPVEKMRVMELIQKTTIEIKCPFADLNFNDIKLKGDATESKQYFFDMESKNDRGKCFSGGNDRQHKKPKVQQWDQEICWFCLSCPSVEKHLIITIGTHFYLALAKGPINDYHILCCSINHIPCAAQLTEEDWKELLRFKKALKKFFKAQNQVVCFTERNYKTSHLQINVFALDEGLAWKIPHAFEDKSEEFNLEFETIPQLADSQMLPQQGPYFVAELPNDTTLITRQMKHFPIHFARDVFCSENLLNCDEKVDWRACKLDMDAEKDLVKNFREKFAKYDFTS